MRCFFRGRSSRYDVGVDWKSIEKSSKIAVDFLKENQIFINNALDGDVDTTLGHQLLSQSSQMIDRWERYGRGFITMKSPEACQSFDDYYGAEINSQIELWDTMMKSSDVHYDGKFYFEC